MLFAPPPAPAGEDDDAASLQDNAADSARLAAQAPKALSDGRRRERAR